MVDGLKGFPFLLLTVPAFAPAVIASAACRSVVPVAGRIVRFRTATVASARHAFAALSVGKRRAEAAGRPLNTWIRRCLERGGRVERALAGMEQREQQGRRA
jgi:hypothetical protein